MTDPVEDFNWVKELVAISEKTETKICERTLHYSQGLFPRLSQEDIDNPDNWVNFPLTAESIAKLLG